MPRQAVLRTGIILVNNTWGQIITSYIDFSATGF